MNAKRLLRTFLLPTLLVLCFIVPLGKAGDGKEGWRQFLPPDTFKELVSREIKIVQAVIGSEDFDAIQEGKADALLLAGHTLSAKGDPKNLEAIRSAALRLAEILGEKDKVEEARKLADAITSLQGDASAQHQGLDFKKYLNNDYYLMVMYMPKEKKGDGLAPELQLSPRLKGTQEYIENLFSFLSKRPLKTEQVDKAAEELKKLAFRTAVSGELIAAYVPVRKTKTRDPELWKTTSKAMIDSALDLADAAEKKDADRIQKSSALLLDSCFACHKMFQ